MFGFTDQSPICRFCPSFWSVSFIDRCSTISTDTDFYHVYSRLTDSIIQPRRRCYGCWQTYTLLTLAICSFSPYSTCQQPLTPSTTTFSSGASRRRSVSSVSPATGFGLTDWSSSVRPPWLIKVGDSSFTVWSPPRLSSGTATVYTLHSRLDHTDRGFRQWLRVLSAEVVRAACRPRAASLEMRVDHFRHHT